ncbi:MAG: hypothetical protein C4576_09280 [Desulfobacteraceae bacterium]|nr:MAG: hypothetical protein C4576_09280 [Desulfobacteraceae bacterium]
METSNEGVVAVAGAAGKPAAGINIRELVSRSGSEALNYILDQDQPRAVVQSMSRVDFYWLVKKVGEEDALPLLQLASVEQWEHLLDMEIWERDRISRVHFSSWVGKLLEANPRALVHWLYGEGELLGYQFLFRNIQVEVKQGDDPVDLPAGYFTLDNIYYIRVLDKENEEVISQILRRMADEDYLRYQGLLLSVSGVLPAELEEELYRRRNVRLAEDGFLPFEEAASLYSYVKADTIAKSCSAYLLDLPVETGTGSPVPLIPFSQGARRGLLIEAAERIPDAALMDRLRLEFAGLCNQMVSADQIRIGSMDVLLDTCRRAAGYLNLGLEELSGGNRQRAEELLKLHPLVLLFQVGFSLTLELKWETERWIRQAWFDRMSLGLGFWGDEWGGVLNSVLKKRPLYHTGQGAGDPRSFESVSEVHESRAVLKRVFVLDKLLEILHADHPLEQTTVSDPLLTFDPLLFTFWIRKRLNLEQGFEPVPLSDVKSFFTSMRMGRKKAPPQLEESRAVFLNDLLQYGEGFEESEKEVLKETLSALWDEFSEDYSELRLSDLEGKFSRFILIRPESSDTPE